MVTCAVYPYKWVDILPVDISGCSLITGYIGKQSDEN